MKNLKKISSASILLTIILSLLAANTVQGVGVVATITVLVALLVMKREMAKL